MGYSHTNYFRNCDGWSASKVNMRESLAHTYPRNTSEIFPQRNACMRRFTDVAHREIFFQNELVQRARLSFLRFGPVNIYVRPRYGELSDVPGIMDESWWVQATFLAEVRNLRAYLRKRVYSGDGDGFPTNVSGKIHLLVVKLL